jgi:hypothetical protein
MGDFAIFNVATRFDHLKPTKVMDRFSSFLKRSPYRFVASRRGTASDLDSLEYFSLHDFPPVVSLNANLYPLVGSFQSRYRRISSLVY